VRLAACRHTHQLPNPLQLYQKVNPVWTWTWMAVQCLEILRETWHLTQFPQEWT
jgi:hypothetical protein